VGPRNKVFVTQQVGFIQISITGPFSGHIRFVVYQQSSKESATGQKFFTLQLDIQSDKIHNPGYIGKQGGSGMWDAGVMLQR
jgi:ubiquitin carboxyl-terminal hydrolase 10